MMANSQQFLNNLELLRDFYRFRDRIMFCSLLSEEFDFPDSFIHSDSRFCGILKFECQKNCYTSACRLFLAMSVFICAIVKRFSFGI